MKRRRSESGVVLGWPQGEDRNGIYMEKNVLVFDPVLGNRSDSGERVQ